MAGSYLGHFLRDLFRIRLWNELRDRSLCGERSDFCHLQLIDVKATTKWHRSISTTGPNDYIIRRTLELVLTGAVASTSRMFRHQEPLYVGASPPSTPLCPCCGQEEEDVSHIYWRCEAFSSLREGFLSDWQSRWSTSFCKDSMLATHGLVPEDVALMRWRCDTFLPEWEYSSHPFPIWLGDGNVEFEEGRLVVYTDGACKRQEDPRVRSAGCGIFVCSDHPWNTAFALPGVVLSSELAELRALLHAIEGATAQHVDILVKLDNQFVADAASAVLSGSKCWPANGHLLWRRLAVAQEAQLSAGCEGHRVAWIKGHATLQDTSLGILSLTERKGNSEADKFASKAATLFICPLDLVTGVTQRAEQAVQVQRYLVEVLLTRHLILLQQRARDEPHVHSKTATSASPSMVLVNPQAIRDAFLALHQF
jgi:ribonuclease HI